jgi:hypothetical protein
MTPTETAAPTEPPAPRVVPPVSIDQINFPLAYAVTYKGETHTELKYRRPNGAEMKRFLNSGGNHGDNVTRVMVDLCELPAAFFDLLDGEDFMAFANVVQGFLNGSRKTLTT